MDEDILSDIVPSNIVSRQVPLIVTLSTARLTKVCSRAKGLMERASMETTRWMRMSWLVRKRMREYAIYSLLPVPRSRSER